MNVVSVIFPYRLEGVWVFDDAATGLVREPFENPPKEIFVQASAKSS